jgi:acyl carrier protein
MLHEQEPVHENLLDEEKLKEIMAAVFRVDRSTITDQSSMDTIQGWDSLRHINLVLALEEEFKVSIADEDTANITSYPLIRLVLEDLLQEAASR